MTKLTCAYFIIVYLTAVVPIVYSAEAEEEGERMRGQFTVASLSDGEEQVLRSFNNVPNEGPIKGIEQVSILAAKCYYALDITDVEIKDGNLLASTSEQSRMFKQDFYSKLENINVLDFLPVQSEFKNK